MCVVKSVLSYTKQILYPIVLLTYFYHKFGGILKQTKNPNSYIKKRSILDVRLDSCVLTFTHIIPTLFFFSCVTDKREKVLR